MKRTLLLALATALAAGAATAQLSEPYASWSKGPASYLMTKAEHKEFDKIASDAQAKAFIELFWAKRDPDLTTALNEFKLDFDQRVAAADQMFGHGKVAGSMTDRGRALIVMGRPSSMSNLPAGAVGQDGPLGEGSGPTMEEKGATEIWLYRKDLLPPSVKANEVYLVFIETRVGTEDFVLDRTDRRNVQGLKLLAEGPERFLLNPKLTEVPRLGMLPGSKAASPAQLAMLAAEPRPWPEGARVHTAQGLQSETTFPLWVHVFFPESVPAATQLVGRVRPAAGGEDAGTFAVAATPLTVAGGRAYEMSFPVDPGRWTVEVAFLSGEQPFAVTGFDATTAAVPAEGTAFSQFYWGVDVRQEAQARFGDPFNVGGWHVIPRSTGQFTNKEQVAYFCYVLRPGLDAEQKPKAELTMVLYSGDRKLTEVPAQPTNLSLIGQGVWMFGSSLPLTGFRKAGDYRLELILRDAISDVQTSVSIPLHVTTE